MPYIHGKRTIRKVLSTNRPTIDSNHDPPLEVRIYERDTVLDQEFYDAGYFLDGHGFGTGDYKSGYLNYGPEECHFHQASELLELLGPESVLDVGCATGPMVLAFHACHLKVVGIDFSEWAVTHPCHPVIKGFLVQGSSEALPFKDKEFDLVTCLDMLEHLPSLDTVLKTVSELSRVAKKNVYIATPMLPFTPEQEKLWLQDGSHIFFTERRFWEWAFEKHGFAIDPTPVRKLFNDYMGDMLFRRA